MNVQFFPTPFVEMTMVNCLETFVKNLLARYKWEYFYTPYSVAKVCIFPLPSTTLS